jgi:hypothetical protein
VVVPDQAEELPALAAMHGHLPRHLSHGAGVHRQSAADYLVHAVVQGRRSQGPRGGGQRSGFKGQGAGVRGQGSRVKDQGLGVRVQGVGSEVRVQRAEVRG